MADFDFLGSLGGESSVLSGVQFIGQGEAGGKANSLITAEEIVKDIRSKGRFTDFTLDIPSFTVIRTDVFDEFMEMNGLYAIALSDAEDSRIA